MSVKSYWYTNFFKQVYANSPTYGGWKASGGDSFKIALCSPAYTPNQDTHVSYNDIIQVVGQGYTAGGQVLTEKTISAASGALVLNAAPVSWAGCVFTVRYAVIYDDSNTGSLNKQLVRWIDFDQDIQLAGDTIEITFDGAGTVTVTPPADVTSPQLSDSIVDGPTLTLTYNETLDTTSVPATSDYTVSVNSVPVTKASVAISGVNSIITLTTAVVSTDIVLISYIVPVTGMVRDLAFNPAAAFSSLSVGNITTPPPPPPPPVDVTPPVVTITSPANLATISNTITVTVTATDANGIVSVVLYVDGVSFSTDTSSPYSFGLDTTTLTNGAHTLVARAVDPSSNIGVSSTINVTVSNIVLPPPDTTAPSVTITSPLANAYLAGTFTIAVIATDNVGVVSATLFVDGVSQGVDPAQPYSFSLDTTLFSNTVHTLVATAIDAAGNVGTSASIPVNIDNQIPVLSSPIINGASLALNYNETLNAASVPLTSAFVVRTDGNTRSLNSVSISGMQVLITLSVAVLAANVVTISYTAPTGAGATPIEDRAGNNAASLTNQAVTNVTPGDTTPPEITALTVSLASLVIQYSENLDTTSVPATSAFAITVNAVARTVSTVGISGRNVTLTLSSAVIYTDTVVAAYTQPATNKVRDIGQNNASAFFNLPVQNITAPPPPPPEPVAPVLSSVSAPDAQTLIWNNTNVANETGYDYETAPTSGGTYTLRGTRPADTVTFTWTGAVENTQYFMRTGSIGPSGTRYYSNILNVTTPPGTPPPPPEPVAPTLSSVSAPASTVIVWNHNNVANELGYEYQTGPASSGPWTLRGTNPADSTSFTWNAATSNVTYFMRVNSFGAAGTRYSSNVLSVTTPATDAATFVSQLVPSTSMTTSTTQTVGVTMRNTGTASWDSPSGYHLYSQNAPGNTTWGLSQVPVPSTVLPNGNAAFSYSITAPSTAGTYPFQWRMRHTTTEFGDQSQSINIIVSPPTSSGNTYFLSTTGSDTNSGSQTSPFRTFNRAASVLVAGDTLYIRGGTYIEQMDANRVASGTALDPTVISGFGSEVAIFRPTSTWALVYFAGTTRAYHTWQNLTFDGGNMPAAGQLATIGQTDTNNIVFNACTFQNARGHGFLVAGVDIQILNSTFTNIGTDNVWPLGNAVYGGAVTRMIVDRVLSFNNYAYGIRIYNSSGVTATDSIIRNCTTHNNGRNSVGGGGILIGDTRQLAHNNVVYNEKDGITIYREGHTPTDCKVLNNTIFNMSSRGVVIASGSIGSQIINNIAFQTSGLSIDDQPGNSTKTTNLTTNPTFINSTLADFHLGAGSTAANTGTSLSSIFTTDKDGFARPFGSAWDIGAYERQF